MKPKSAMIFAAGFGTRMAPLTDHLPKPMVPLGARPMIDHAIDLLRDAGIANIVANTHYLRDRIEPHLKSRGVAVSPEQPGILDTGGGMLAALPLLGNGPVITINPDALWRGSNPIAALMAAWQNDMAALLNVVHLKDTVGPQKSGDFSLEHGEIRRGGDFVYGGAQIIQTERLTQIPGPAFSLNAYWDLLAGTGPLNGVQHQGTWYDIGTPHGLALAESALGHV